MIMFIIYVINIIINIYISYSLLLFIIEYLKLMVIFRVE